MTRTAHLLLHLTAATTLAFAPATAGTLWDNFTQFFVAPKSNEVPKLRLLLAEDQDKINVDVSGPFKVYDPRTGEHVITRKMGKSGMVTPIEDGLAWGEEFPGIYQITIVPHDSSVTTKVNGIDYQGTVTIYQIEDKLSAVNTIDMERFLASVITPLFPEAAPNELLAAIAISARTNAYFLAENPKNPFWAIKAENVDYAGYQKGRQHVVIEDAIAETRHMVLSQTGTYEKTITPFPNHWIGSEERTVKTPVKSVASKISLKEAEQMAEKGRNASQILNKAFPKASIELIYSSPKGNY